MIKPIEYEVETIYEIDSYGGVHFTNLISDEFVKMGYELKDIVEVSFLDNTILLPIVNDFNYLDMGKSGLTLHNIDSVYVKLIAFGDIFAVKYGIVEPNQDGPHPWKVKEGVTFPIKFTIKMHEKQGYANEYKIFDLNRTNNREDYASMSDEDFANFREVRSSKMKPGILYRGSSPIDPKLQRDKITDDALRTVGVKTIINFVNKEEKAVEFPHYFETYYSKQNILFIPAPVYFFGEKYQDVLRKTIRFMLAHEGPYFFHCWEGKDRTGFICALLLCLVGAARNEIIADYMASYTNFFQFEKGSETYMHIALRIYHLIKRAFDIDEVSDVDLSKKAYDYFVKIGLSEEEVTRLRDLLKR